MKKQEFINVGGKLLSIRTPLVMGVVNVTSDSFYEKSRHSSPREVITSVERMIREGADIIDIGGLSTRPGATEGTVEEEKGRVIEILKSLRREFPEAVLSIDTYRSSVAREAFFEAGVNMVNDISGGTMDDEMFPLIKEINIPYVMMHISGTPSTMHNHAHYDDVVSDIVNWFAMRVPPLLQAGIKDIIIDPGIGFGKTIGHNFEILTRLSEFSVTGMPLLIGLSRKSLIWKTLGVTPDHALNGTTALNMAALMNGANILRVHDVAEAIETVRLFEKMQDSKDSRR
jgi:dihydropteroate synthase